LLNPQAALPINPNHQYNHTHLTQSGHQLRRRSPPPRPPPSVQSASPSLAAHRRCYPLSISPAKSVFAPPQTTSPSPLNTVGVLKLSPRWTHSLSPSISDHRRHPLLICPRAHLHPPLPVTTPSSSAAPATITAAICSGQVLYSHHHRRPPPSRRSQSSTDTKNPRFVVHPNCHESLSAPLILDWAILSLSLTIIKFCF
jgi:hypothetical protein